jgi:ribonuclease HII
MGICDSKKVSASKRSLLVQHLKSKEFVDSLPTGLSFCYQLALVESHEIDKINILQASLLAMQNSWQKLNLSLDHIVLVDGPYLFEAVKNKAHAHALVKGDSRSLLIAAASLMAKEMRDQLMSAYHQQYPYYRFDKNAGYPTAIHRQALKHYGPCPIHRRSFKGVEQSL